MASPEATSGLPQVRPTARARPVVGEPFAKALFGDRRGLFGLLVKNTLLTIVTLGVYRFWARTAIRRFYWGNVAVAGDRFEYTGTGAELFVGFLIAMMMLAPLFGGFAVVQLLTDPKSPWRVVETVIYVIAIYVFIATALFRARRYRLSRTRWRGIRFAQEGSTWRFIGLTLAWTALVVATLGIGFPWLRWAQQRYMMRATLLGDRRFGFVGSPRTLVWRWLLVLACFFLPIILAVLLVGMIYGSLPAVAADVGADPDDPALPKIDPEAARRLTIIALLPLFALLAGGLAFVNYRIAEFRAFAGATRLGAVTVRSTARVGPVIGAGLRAIGWFIALNALFMVLCIVLVVVLAVLFGAGLTKDASQIGVIVGIGAGVTMVGGFLLALPLVVELVIRFRILRHVVTTLELARLDTLDDIAQSAAAAPRVGEGLADAFDIGSM